MTTRKDLKRIIRTRQKKTNESYTAARAHVLRARDARLGVQADAAQEHAEAVVLTVNRSSVRARVLNDHSRVTFQSRDAWRVVPGQLVTLVFKTRWTLGAGAHASGRIENPRIDVGKIGLEPLPLSGGEPVDLRDGHEPFEDPDPYAPFWRQLTAKPRPSFQMDPIAWGAFPGTDRDDNLTCDAAELAEVGDFDGSRRLLMKALAKDLRCIDAHAHLGRLEFDRNVHYANAHYMIGVRIGELSLPPGFDGVLIWGHIYNRPFLRCLRGHGLCLWRLGMLTQARQVFERILALSPYDNQGVRACWDDVRRGLRWEDADERDYGPRDHSEHRESLH